MQRHFISSKLRWNMKLGFSSRFAILFNVKGVFVIIAKDLRRMICARFNLRSRYYISRGNDEGGGGGRLSLRLVQESRRRQLVPQ